jgi:hypothetical protein
MQIPLGEYQKEQQDLRQEIEKKYNKTVGQLYEEFEAKFDDRFECLLELPKGKVVAAIEPVDAIRAKQILGNHACILLRAPTSSKLWSLREVEAYTKEQIDKCGKGGGLILDIRIPDRAQKEDIQAMLESIKEYGKY